MPKLWFEHDWSQDDPMNRRRDENRMQRIAKESHEQEEGLVEHWLDLAKRMFDSDDDPDPQAA
jgi:hypothetical protein